MREAALRNFIRQFRIFTVCDVCARLISVAHSILVHVLVLVLARVIAEIVLNLMRIALNAIFAMKSN